jgi:hypothetical protein
MCNAYIVGYNAHKYGYAKLSQCPYMRGSYNAVQWVEGWKACVCCAN